MNEKKKMQPKVRFREFTGENTPDWEHRKLGEVAEIVAGGDVDKSKLKEYGKYPVIANALTNEGIVGYYDDYYRIKTPAVTVTGRGDIGHAKARDTNFTPVVRLLTLISKHNSLFLENAINLKRIYSESTGVPQLTAPQLSKYKIGITDIEEEIVIGTFFYKLDKLITLHQRKLEQLEQLKNTLLSKMFPKSGTNIPEIRFSGFTDAWKQRQLENIFFEFSIKSKKENEAPLLSSTNKGMEFREGRVSGESNLGYKLITNNDLVLSPQNLWLGNINFNNLGTGIVSPSYKTFKCKNVEIDFIRPQLRNNHMMYQYKNASTQGASIVRRNLDLDLFNQIRIYIPSSEEQKIIGKLFNKIDNSIAIHQRKLEQLKNLKQTLLNKMFI